MGRTVVDVPPFQDRNFPWPITTVSGEETLRRTLRVFFLLDCFMYEQHASYRLSQEPVDCLKSQATCYSISGTDLLRQLHVLPSIIAMGPSSPSTDPITPGAWQGSHWYDSTRKIPSQEGIEPRIFRSPGRRSSPRIFRSRGGFARRLEL